MATKRKLSPEAAKALLSPVEQKWQAFWFNNGPVVNSLEQMQKSLARVKKSTFVHHVNKKKNDLALWVQYVIGDKELAKKLKKNKTRQTAANTLKRRISALQKAAKVKAKAKRKR